MGRRSHGEGSIYRRKKDGLWAAQYLVDTPDGKTKRKYVYGKKRKDVAEKLAEALKGRGEGLLLDAGSLTVAEFLADWMDSEKESVRESTQARREQVLRLHVYPNIGHRAWASSAHCTFKGFTPESWTRGLVRARLG